MDQRDADYREQETGSNSGTDIGTGLGLFLIGIGVGAAVALLVAPMKGSDLRTAISQKCRNAFDGISEQTRNLRDRGSNLLGFKGRQAVGGEYN